MSPSRFAVLMFAWRGVWSPRLMIGSTRSATKSLSNRSFSAHERQASKSDDGKRRGFGNDVGESIVGALAAGEVCRTREAISYIERKQRAVPVDIPNQV